MTTLPSPHDRFFKAVFGRTEVAAEFLERLDCADGAAWRAMLARRAGVVGPRPCAESARREGGPDRMRMMRRWDEPLG